MKKMIYIACCIVCWGFSACSDSDNGADSAVSSLNITKAEVDFQAKGGDGVIEVAGSSDLKAVSSADWCTITSVTADKVAYSVAVNERLESRVAIITLSAADGEAKRVSIIQAGFVCEYDQQTEYRYEENAAFTQEIKFTSSLDITVSVAEDAQSWLTYEKTETGFRFTGQANDTGSDRRIGNVTISAGPKEMVYTFIQYDIHVTMEDLLGIWNVQFNDRSKMVDSQAQISEVEGGKYQMLIALENGTIPFEVEFKDEELLVPMGQYVGMTTQNLPLYAFAMDNAAVPAFDASIVYKGVPSVDRKGNLILIFGTDDEWAATGMFGIGIFGFSATPPSAETFAGYLGYIIDLTFTEKIQ